MKHGADGPILTVQRVFPAFRGSLLRNGPSQSHIKGPPEI